MILGLGWFGMFPINGTHRYWGWSRRVVGTPTGQGFGDMYRMWWVVAQQELGEAVW